MVGVFSLVSVVSVQVWYVMIALTLLRDSIDTATEGETEGRMAARSMQQELQSWNLLLLLLLLGAIVARFELLVGTAPASSRRTPFASGLIALHCDRRLVADLRCRLAIANSHFDLPQQSHDLLRLVSLAWRTPSLCKSCLS